MRKVFENLKPGGWVEYHDMMFNIDSDDLTHRGTGIHKWSHLALAGAAAKGRDMEVARKYKDYMIEAGFVDVTEIKFKLPGNGWPTKQPEQTIGKYTVVSGTEVIKTISDRLLGEGLGLPEDVLRPIIAEAQKDVSDEDIHYWWPG